MSSTGNHYDFIVVGSGAGGGTFAGIAAVAGAKVLVIERGPLHVIPGNEHLANQRLSVYGHNAGPDRTQTRMVDGVLHLPGAPGVQANAAMLGGGTQVYGAQAWRFHPNDFRMASHYGIPDGSSLADWPIDYTDLEPWYAIAERMIGVSGSAASMVHLPTFLNEYPMPRIPCGKPGDVFRHGIAKLGWRSCTVPLAINSVRYDNRPGCQQCEECVGFACKVDAKNGSHNTWLKRGLQSGNLDLLYETVAVRVNHSKGIVNGASIVNHESGPAEVTCDHLVCSAGAIETARLLLASGIDNPNIGRNLQGHVYTGVTGLFSEVIRDGKGPGPTTAITEFLHNNDGIIGGGMLADEFVMTPVTYWKRHRPSSVPTYGSVAKFWMKNTYPRVLDIKGPIQDVPSPSCRVEISSSRSDNYGMPIVELHGHTHPESLRASRFMYERARELMYACGAEDVWGTPQSGRVRSAGQHQAGTCRMAEHPMLGVVDPHQKVFGFRNLHICDASVHVTNGTFNPVLTIYALSHRLASHLTGWKPE
ncbi:MAG: GMC family oxidoreductase [Armatimonadota bacterium]